MDQPLPAAASPPAALTPENMLAGLLERVRRRVKLREFLARALIIAAVASIVPLLAVVADHTAYRGLPRLVIAGLGVLYGLVLLAACVFAIVAARRRLVSQLFAARAIESAGSIVTNSLINAVLLRGSRASRYAGAPAARQALREAANVPVEACVPPVAGRKLWIVAFAILAAWLLYALVSPKAVFPSLARFFGADIAAPTATRIVLIAPAPTDAVHANEPLRLEFEFRGRPVAEALLEAWSDGANSTARVRQTLTRGSGEVDRREWRLAPHEVTDAPLRVRCSAGDGVLETVIHVRPQPEMTDLRIELTPPAYTAAPPETTIDPELTVWAGTRLRFIMAANVALRDALLVLEGGQQSRTRMPVAGGDSHSAAGEIVVTQSGSYRIEFTDETGYAARHTPQHSITVRADEPPALEILHPPAEARPVIDVTQFSELRVTATDDVGIAALAFCREEAGTIVRQELLNEIVRRPARATVPIGEIAISPGQQVRCWFETADNRETLAGENAGQLVRSEVLTLMRPVEKPKGSGTRAQPGDDEEEPGEESTEGANGRGRDGENGDEPGEGAGDQAGQGEGGQPGEGQGENGDAGASQNPGDAGGDDSGAGEGAGNGDMESKLREFAREFGEEAREAAERLRENADQPGEAAGESEAEGESGENGADAGANGAPPEGADQSGSEGNSADGKSQGGNAPSKQSPEGSGSGAPPADDSGSESQGGAPSSGTTPGAGAPAPAGGDTPPPAPGDPPAAEDNPAAQESSEPPKTGDAAGDLDSQGAAERRAVLELLKRGRELRQSDLEELGWPPQKAAAFLKALRDLQRAARESGSADGARAMDFDPALGSDEVQRGTQRSADLATDVGEAGGTPSGPGAITPPREQTVPAELRAILEAYYRSLATSAAEQGK